MSALAKLTLVTRGMPGTGIREAKSIYLFIYSNFFLFSSLLRETKGREREWRGRGEERRGEVRILNVAKIYNRFFV